MAAAAPPPPAAGWFAYFTAPAVAEPADSPNGTIADLVGESTRQVYRELTTENAVKVSWRGVGLERSAGSLLLREVWFLTPYCPKKVWR